jgi:hypothetical protein
MIFRSVPKLAVHCHGAPALTNGTVAILAILVALSHAAIAILSVLVLRWYEGSLRRGSKVA